MTKVSVPINKQSEQFNISPQYARISMAAAIQLGLKKGKFYRGAECGCINLLQNYPEGCYANCTYCGLARERPGVVEDNTFIRVSWPLYSSDILAGRIRDLESRSGVGRVCISQVQDPRSNADLLAMTKQIHDSVPDVPISALVNATTMSRELFVELKNLGVDDIGFGLDGASERIFYENRGRGAKSPHDWNQHWEMISTAREIFGPMKVNCHIIVGLGETDRELVDLFFRLTEKQIKGYLFSFNAEPGSALQNVKRQPISRHRRIQLVKYLIVNSLIKREEIVFDDRGSILMLHVPAGLIERAINNRTAFMTDGCPDRNGKMTCNRPFGSYKPGEEFRDYPFLPNQDDLKEIREQMRIEDILVKEAAAVQS